MTQAPEAEVIELAIVACETCDQLFLESPRRQTCPGCGGGAGLRFFEYSADQAGLHLRNGAVSAEPASARPEPVEGLRAIAGPEDEEEEDDVDDGEEAGAAPTASAPDASDQPWRVTPVTIGSKDLLAMIGALVLSGAHPDATEFRDELLSRGVPPEDVAAAVGRLQAVAVLIMSVPERPTGEEGSASEETEAPADLEPAGEPETAPPPA